MHIQAVIEWRLIFAWFASSWCSVSSFIGWRRPSGWVCCGSTSFRYRLAAWLASYTSASYRWSIFRWPTSLIGLIVKPPLAWSCCQICACFQNHLLVSIFLSICFQRDLCWICWSFRSFQAGNAAYFCAGCCIETRIGWASCFCSWLESWGSMFFQRWWPLVWLPLHSLHIN